MKNKTLNLDQWENEHFLGATDLNPEILKLIKSNSTFHLSLESLNNTSTSINESNEEEWMFI